MQYGTLYVQQKAKVANEYVGVTARPISCMFNEQRKPFGSDVLRFLINKLPASPPSTLSPISQRNSLLFPKLWKIGAMRYRCVVMDTPPPPTPPLN